MEIGSSFGWPGGDCVACWKKTCDRKRARPMATRLITTPDTIWSTRNVIVAIAWMLANNAPATSPTNRPISGPQGWPHPISVVKVTVPHDPVTVPMIIMPSRPMFTMPERSLYRPPSPVR